MSVAGAGKVVQMPSPFAAPNAKARTGIEERKMRQKLLIVSDAVTAPSGLARITRELAERIYVNLSDVIDVATCGYGGVGSNSIPWTDYHLNSIENWVIPELPQVAKDFAGDEELTILVIWDCSRLAWFADPDYCPIPSLRAWLQKAKIRKWTYSAIDAAGPQGGLSVNLKRILGGFERVLNYSKFSAQVTGYPDFIPHGIDTSAFFPHDRNASKDAFRAMGFVGLERSSFLIGIVATNQVRKDWALGFQTAKELLDRGKDVRLWCHVDTIQRFWDLGALVEDYGLQGRVIITVTTFTDEQMSLLYSACDVVLAIGRGEGFGFSAYESLASGTPIVAGNYCGSEWTPPSMKVMPIGFNYEGPHCMKRPVYEVKDWADCAEEQEGVIASLPAELDWEKVWVKWEKWFRDGLR